MTPSEKAKDKRLQKIYKRTLAEFNTQVEEQGGGCAICGKSFSKYTAFQDHFHGCCPRRLKEYCGKCNRGLLCFVCNKFVVGVIERQNIPVDKLATYMQKWEHLNPGGWLGLAKPKKKKGK